MGNLVDLSKDGQFHAANDNAYASLGYNAELGLDLCNGIDLQLQGEAFASAGLSYHFANLVKASLDVQAGVEAGVRVAGQLSPDIMEEIGLTLSVQAYLKAYVRARLELKLTLQEILDKAILEQDSFQYKIFESFINQLEVGAGIEANAQVALTAKAHIICQARLFEKNGKKPGFDFGVDAEAAFLFGAGFNLFAMARFDDIDRFLAETIQHIIDELNDSLKDKLDPDNRVHQFAMSMLGASLKLVLDAGADTISKKRDNAFETLVPLLGELVLDEVNDLLEDLLEDQFKKVDLWLAAQTNLSDEDYNHIANTLGKIIKHVEEAKELKDIFSVINELVILLENINYDRVDDIISTLTHLQLCAYLFDTQNRSFWKNLPAYASTSYQEVTGNSITVLSNNQEVYLYLESSCLTQFITSHTGEAGKIIKDILQALNARGYTISQLIQLLTSHNTAALKKDMLVLSLEMVSDIYEKYILKTFDDFIAPLLSQTTLGQNYYNDVIKNALYSSHMLFSPLLIKVITQNKKADKAALDYLSKQFLLALVSKNISFFAKELLNYGVDSMESGIDSFEQKIKRGEVDIAMRRFFNLCEDFIQNAIPFVDTVNIPNGMENDIIDETEDMLLKTMHVSKKALGRNTWSNHRINTLTDSLERMIAGPDSGMFDFEFLKATQDIEALIKEVTDCSFLPDITKYELGELTNVMSDIAIAQLKFSLSEMPKITGEYIAKILEIVLYRLINEILDAVADAYDDFKEWLNDKIEELEESIKNLKKIIEDLAADIEEKIDELFDNLESEIEKYFSDLAAHLDIDDLGWLGLLEAIWDFVTLNWNEPSDETKARNVLEELKNQAIKNLNDPTTKAQIISRLKSGNVTESTVSDFINSSIISSDITSKIDKISFKKDSQGNDIKREVAFNLFESIFDKSNELKSSAFSFEVRSNQLLRVESDLNMNKNTLSYLERKDAHFNDLQNANIKINSPLPVDVKTQDAPIYGNYLYIEVDFDRLRIKDVINSQLEFEPDNLVNINNDISASEFIRKLKWNMDDLKKTPPLYVSILINGNNIDLKQCTVTNDNILRAHIHKDLLKNGMNSFSLAILTDESRKDLQFKKTITFMRQSYRGKKNLIPTNSLFINLEKSVINTPGNDHEDARSTNLSEKEVIYITNLHPEAFDINGYTLTDAAGHSYTFSERVPLKPKSDVPVFVGNTLNNKYSWIARYHGIPIAILNNKGEFLKLTAPDGRVVSHVYTGTPSTNPHITFIK